MIQMKVRLFILALAIAVTPMLTVSAPAKKNAPPAFKFTGTVIDNKSLKLHKDSLDSFLPHLKKEDVYNNVAWGYSLYTTDGKIYTLCRESTNCFWNVIKPVRGRSVILSLKISGNAQNMGDSLKILDCYDAK
jgi:hypothetical protein